MSAPRVAPPRGGSQSRRRLLVAVAVVASAMAHGQGQVQHTTATVAGLAADFFASRGVVQVVMGVCESGRTSLTRALAADGRLQVQAVQAQTTAPHLATPALQRPPVLGVLVWSCRPSLGERLDVDASTLNGSYFWLLVDPPSWSAFELGLRLDSEVTVARPLWELLELFRPSGSVDARLERVGFWSTSMPTRDRAHGTVEGEWHLGIAFRRMHVPGVTVREAIYMWQQVGEDVMARLLEMPRAEAMPLLTPLAMHAHVVFMNIVARFNMTVIKRIARTKPGQLNADPGTPFDGTMGLVERGEADIWPGCIITADRGRPMVFSATSWTLRTVCGFLTNTALGSADAVVKPFQPWLWVAVIGLSVVVALLEKCFRALEHTDPEHGGASWSDVLISCFGTLTGQGFLACGDWVSGRALLATFEAFFLLTQAYYNASIVTFLLRPPPSSIRSVRDLVESPYKVACHGWIHTARVLQNSTDPLVRELFHRKVEPPRGLGFLGTADAMAALRRPRVGLVASDDVVDEAAASMTRQETCRLQQLDVDMPLVIALGTARNAPFKEMMHSGTILQVERGIAHRERIVWRQRRPSCDRNAGGEFAPLELLPVLPPLVLMGAMVSVAAVLCAAERVRAASVTPVPRAKAARARLQLLARGGGRLDGRQPTHYLS